MFLPISLSLFILLGYYPRSTMFICVHNVMLIDVLTLTRNMFGPSRFLTVHLNFVSHYTIEFFNLVSHNNDDLGEAIERWIQHHFFRAKRAKCLIIIGPTGTGKTAFALSLPGRPNYYQERWRLDTWNDYARYSVYDDIPWDNFDKLNFPAKKNLLTHKWTQINVRQSKPSPYLLLYDLFCLLASI